MRAYASFLILSVSLLACGSVAPSGTSISTHDGGVLDAARAGDDARSGEDAPRREAASDAAPACVPTFLEAGTGREGDAEVPRYHRAGPSCCTSARGRSSGQPYASNTTNGCATDSDCTAAGNGRCFPAEGLIGPGGCSYDECLTDSECPSQAPCLCRASATGLTANTCATPGTCVLDSDCGPDGFCSPSTGPCGYPTASSSVLAGAAFFCHTGSDTCLNESDCSTPPGDAGDGCPIAHACTFDPQAKHWSCTSDRCCPP